MSQTIKNHLHDSVEDFKELINSFGKTSIVNDSSKYVKLRTKKEIEQIPSFIASSNQTHIITNVSKNKYDQIQKILSFYDDQLFKIQEDEDDVIITKQEKKSSSCFPVSKLTIPNFNEIFETKKIFDPIIIETEKKNCLGENLEILIKALISKHKIIFEEDLDFKTLKDLFGLKGEDKYIIKKNDIQKLQKYCNNFDIFEYVDSEKLRLGVLNGITDFRIGNTLYDVRNRSTITKRDFFQLYTYAVMLGEILNIVIDKLIIISPIMGEEYIMKYAPNEDYINFIKNYKTTEIEL